jgi:hypothetical protein
VPTRAPDRTPLLIVALGLTVLIVPHLVAALVSTGPLDALAECGRYVQIRWTREPVAFALGWFVMTAPWLVLSGVAHMLLTRDGLTADARRRRATAVWAGVVGVSALTLLLHGPFDGRLALRAENVNAPLIALLALPLLCAGGTLAARASE